VSYTVPGGSGSLTRTPTIALDIDIAAAPDRVFAALLDTASYEDWVPAHDGWPGGPPALTPAASFTQAVTVIGRSAEIEWTVHELNPPSRLALAGEGPMGFTMHAEYHLQSVDRGTSLRYRADLAGGPVPLTGRVGGVMLKRIRTGNEESLASLKALIESDRAPGAARRSRPRSWRWRRTRSDDVLAAIEANTSAIQALTYELARANEQASRLSWLVGPLELLRRASPIETNRPGDRFD
jgi:uncharacterized protein YndB with AHSA1/START domain